MGCTTESTGKAARILLCTVSFVLSFTESPAFSCFYGNLEDKSSIQTCITDDPPPECYSVVGCGDPSQICYTYGNITPTTNTFNYFSGCLLMDECQSLKGSLEDCGVIGFVAALFLNREHFCSTCCEDPYCNDLGLLQHLIPIPKTTTTVITSSIPSTVTTEEQQTTTGALVETSRLVSTSTKPQTNTQAVEEQESTLTPTTDDASHKLAATDLTPDKPDTTMIQDPKTAKKGTETTAETSSSVVTSETPFTTTHAVDAVDESTSLLMKDITTHGLVSTSIFSISDTTQTAVITAESSTSEENAETSIESGVDETTESKLTKDSFTSWYGYTSSTITTTGMTSSYPVESSQDYEKYCNSSKEAVFGVTRRGLHGLNVFFSRLDNTPPCIYGKIQHKQPSVNFPLCANACLMSDSCQFLSFNRSKKMCTIFSFSEV